MVFGSTTLVGISLDGLAALHDAYRVDKGGKLSFEPVMHGLNLLKRHGVEFNTLTTVHRKNAMHALEVYRFLRATGSGYLQLTPIVERNAAAPSTNGLWLAPPRGHADAEGLDTQVTEWSVRPIDYGTFLCEILDEWIRHDVGKVFVQQFDAALANWIGQPAGICIFSPDCGSALAVEHNDDSYRCDHYVYPRNRLDNLLNSSLPSLVNSVAQQQFGQARSATLPRYCCECSVCFACHGECPKHRFLRTPHENDGLNYLCAGYKKLFRHIDSPMRTMSALLGLGRAPAEIKALPRSQWLPSGLQS